ncbi:mannonate dehydratase [Ascidiaceihabitans sp.]|uniref:mannonate dehydratase n=1 Tax=Ascidiaceihabitans sp. TaxID=1872644 RepID=UPI003298DF98
MKQTWRWFGPQDPIALADLHQVGVQGIVTALHQFPPGCAWPEDAIDARCALLKDAGFQWDVVESLPVSEAIKTKGGDRADHIAAYKTSLERLASRGIQTICYNFMPVLDWTRTDLAAVQPHGGTAMAFDLVDFAAFDLCILKRPTATKDYDDALSDMAHARFAAMTDSAKQKLQHNITAGLPGANDTWNVQDVARHLSTYDGISPQDLRQNLIDFLSDVVPVAERLGMRLCCHPDDPPFPLLGLPRVMSSTDDYAAVLDAVNSPANGATLCTGSLGVDAGFDPADFVRRLGARIHFVHLRNTKREETADKHRPSFYEAPHLEGDTDMVATVHALMAEQDRRRSQGRADWNIPMRPDHGQALLGDLHMESTPGYPLIGRMRGLAELRGIMAGWRSV